MRIGDVEEELSWEQFEQRVANGRIPEYAMICFEPVTGTSFVPASDLDAYNSLRQDSKRAWADAYRSGSPPWMTALIAGVQIRIWWFTWTDGWPEFMDWFALYNPSVLERGEVWRMITAGLMHQDPFHILSNLVMMVYVGWHLERALGRLNLLTLFVASVVGGSVMSVLLTPQSPSIGSSGGVLGLVAATTVFGFVRYGLLAPRAQAIFGWALAPYLVLIYGMGWMGENTDNWAHTGGLVTGALLALVLDPPLLQRRKHWNTVALGAIWTGIAAVFVTFLVAGPYMMRTHDVLGHPSLSAAAQTAARSRDTHRELSWTAPSTWSRGTHLGNTGYVSRVDDTRSWSLAATKRSRPVDLPAQTTEWLNKLRQDWSVVQVSSQPATLAGVPATRLVVSIDDRQNTHIEMTQAARGNHLLRATWIGPEPSGDRLRPVHDQLLSEVEWLEPGTLHTARIASQRAPKNRALRRRLADELLANGDVDQALVIYRGLAKDRAGVAASWVGLIKVSRWYPKSLANDDSTWDAALSAGELPEVTAEVALAIHEAGRTDTARGLLELAWVQLPGDRYLRRARKSINMPVALSDAAPAHLRYDPTTGALLDAPRAPDLGDIDLEKARVEGELLANNRAILLARVERSDGATALGPLLLYKRGLLNEADSIQSQLKGLVDDLSTLRQGGQVRWITPEVARWASSHESDDEWMARLTLAASLPDTNSSGPQSAEQALQRVGLELQDDPDGPSFRLFEAPRSP